MIYAQQGLTFTARILSAGGLVVAVQVIDPANAAVLVADTLAVEEPVGTYTVELVAPSAAGDGHAFEMVWTIPGDDAVSEDLVVTVDAPDVNVAALPDVSEVAAFLRARTRDSFGNEIGTFNTNTRPSRAQVLGLIGMAQTHVAGAVGFRTLSAPIARMARTATALRAAIMIELSFFPEQVESGRSPVSVLRELYAEEIARLEHNARDADGGGIGVGITDDARLPRYRVDRDPNPTTFDTRW